MKFGVREICDVVLRAKAQMPLGTTTFEKDMPVLYFDSLKTSSLEGASTTVYAQGGKGNSRLIAWEGEKTVTFTMEDALISKQSIAVLSGANLIEKTNTDSDYIPVHMTETVELGIGKTFTLSEKPIQDANNMLYTYLIPLDSHGDINGSPLRVDLTSQEVATATGAVYNCSTGSTRVTVGNAYLVDYYTSKASHNVSEIQITPDKFAGNYYLEASTLFRNRSGEDLPAEFIIPNCKIQSNFTFTLASTGDPSTFTFTMDAFPDYTKYNRTKKVLAAIQVIEKETAVTETAATKAGDYSIDSVKNGNTQYYTIARYNKIPSATDATLEELISGEYNKLLDECIENATNYTIYGGDVIGSTDRLTGNIQIYPTTTQNAGAGGYRKNSVFKNED